MSVKHFNSGCVFGKIADEPKKETSEGGKEYVTFKVSASGWRSGSVTAYCRMWGEERITPFLQAWRSNPTAPLFLKGFYGQYRGEKNEWLSNFTIFQYEQREAVDPRAVFVLRGEVGVVSDLSDGGQRMIMAVHREGQQAEEFELWCPGELLFDRVKVGDAIEAKGYVRQESTEDEFGGSAGPIHAYVHQLQILTPF